MSASPPALRVPSEVAADRDSLPLEGLAGARGWRGTLAVALSAVVTLLVADRLLARLAPIDYTLVQTEHGVRELQRGNPRALVLGSSHARSFPAVRALIETRSGERDAMVVVPEEGGTFSAYNWILQNRLRPLIDETDPTGRRVRDRLRDVLLITTYFDLCPEDNNPAGVVAHGWTLRHFASDVREHGITARNRNYLRARWNELFPWSSLVQDRGVFRIGGKLRWLLPGAEDHEKELRERYRREIEEASTTCQDDAQRRSLEEAIAYLEGRGIDVTLVLFPVEPGLITQRSKETTLLGYSGYIEEVADRHGLRVADMTSNTPLGREDFQKDLDHLNPEGNQRFAAWALDHELAFLLPPPPKP